MKFHIFHVLYVRTHSQTLVEVQYNPRYGEWALLLSSAVPASERIMTLLLFYYFLSSRQALHCICYVIVFFYTQIGKNCSFHVLKRNNETWQPKSRKTNVPWTCTIRVTQPALIHRAARAAFRMAIYVFHGRASDPEPSRLAGSDHS